MCMVYMLPINNTFSPMFKLFQPNEEFSEQYEHVGIQCALLAPFFLGNDIERVHIVKMPYLT